MQRAVVLVVDAEAARRAAMQEALTQAGFAVLGAVAWPDALQQLRRRPIAVVMLDAAAPGVRDVESAVREVEAARPCTAVVLARAAVDAVGSGTFLDAGLFDAFPADADDRRWIAAAAGAERHARMTAELRDLRKRIRGAEGFDRIVGRTPVMEALRERIAVAARGDAPALMIGEEGSGRSLAARVVHETSRRADRSFSVVHVSAFPIERLEVELFGVEPGPRGRTTTGVLDATDGGTLYLDEVGALPLELQERLAKYLDDGVVRRAGRSIVRSDARIIGSTARDLERAVEDGRFDAGLFAKLSSTTLVIPPLRTRVDDIALLTRHFLDAIAEINGLPAMSTTPDTMEVLRGYRWPGNVRELRNALEQAAILSSDGVVRSRELPDRVFEGGARDGAVEADMFGGTFRHAKKKVVGRFERRYLGELMARNAGNVTVAAQEAGMLRSALQRLLRKHRLRSVDFRTSAERGRSAEPESRPPS